MVLFKEYIATGIYQATSSNVFKLWYLIFSLLTLGIGVITLAILFPKGINGMTFTQNFVIALMVSVILCEIILGLFFLVDEIVFIAQKYFSGSASSKGNDVKDYDRRRFIKTVGLVVSSIPFASFLYGITKGKYDFKVIENKLSFPDLPRCCCCCMLSTHNILSSIHLPKFGVHLYISMKILFMKYQS